MDGPRSDSTDNLYASTQSLRKALDDNDFGGVKTAKSSYASLRLLRFASLTFRRPTRRLAREFTNDGYRRFGIGSMGRIFAHADIKAERIRPGRRFASAADRLDNPEGGAIDFATSDGNER